MCGDIVIPRGGLVCEACKDTLFVITEPRCKKCSKPIEKEEQEYCYDCATKQYHFKRGIALWLYDKTMKKSIADFKYHNRKEYADFYVAEFVKQHADKIVQMHADILVPIPVHSSKLKVRGYNQAAILAQKLGKELSIPVVSDLLIRDKKTLPQKGLNDKERLKNLSHAFRINEKAMHGMGKIKRIILVDDIYTTGCTMEACASVLIHKGNMEVYFLSLCIGKGY